MLDFSQVQLFAEPNHARPHQFAALKTLRNIVFFSESTDEVGAIDLPLGSVARCRHRSYVSGRFR